MPSSYLKGPEIGGGVNNLARTSGYQILFLSLTKVNDNVKTDFVGTKTPMHRLVPRAD